MLEYGQYPRIRYAMSDCLHRLITLLYFMAPAYLANMAPPFLRYWKGWNSPIHERLLGSHKTVLGFASGVLAGVLAAAAQAWIAVPSVWTRQARWPWMGLAFGLGAMTGDSLKSLLKRQRGIAPGMPWPGWDQLDFVVVALLLTSPWAWLSWADVLAILAMSLAGDLAVNRIAFLLGIKQSRW